MRVAVHLTKFYEKVPLEPDVQAKMTNEDIEVALQAGLLAPSATGGLLMRVPVDEPRVLHINVSEADVVEKIIHEKCDYRRAKRVFSRRQALAHLLQEDVIHHFADSSWIDRFEVIDDDGPEPELLQKRLDIFTLVKSPRTGMPCIDPTHVTRHHSLYGEPVTKAEHEEHLHVHFGVAAKAVKP